ncbi:unnamed protein product [Rhodiola kirilowii]
MAFPSGRYHYSFEVYESPPPIRRDRGEDDGTFMTTVKMRFLKIDESAAVAADIECFVHLSAVVTMEERLVLNVISECLNEIGVPEVCHARMVAELMKYINARVIMEHRYESETVVMNIVQTTGFVEGGVVEEVLRRSDDHMAESAGRGRQWMLMDMGVQESWASPEEVEGNIQVAVEILRTPEQSTVTVEHQPPPLYLEVVVFQPQDDFEGVVNRCRPASEAAIANLEKIEQGHEVGAMSCVICEDEDEQGGFSRMPCRHMFHSKCIETWLGTSSSCPLCRYALS